MKIILIHGEHVERSYKKYQQYLKKAKKSKWEIGFIDLKKTSISLGITAKSLFTDKTLYIVANVNSLTTKDLSWVVKNQDKLDSLLIIFHEGNINKSKLKGIKIDKEEKFDLPKYLWKFLDSFYPGNSKACVKLFHETIKNEPVEFVFSLLSKNIKDLYLIKLDKNALPYPNWRVEKLKKQANKFNKIRLKELINNFSEIDIKSKTSRLNISDLLDFIIATKLE